MISRYLEKLEEEFVKHGGIKERMYAARTSYRKAEEERMRQLEKENTALKVEVERLQRLLSAAGIKY